jgi:hypothetical protein
LVFFVRFLVAMGQFISQPSSFHPLFNPIILAEVWPLCQECGLNSDRTLQAPKKPISAAEEFHAGKRAQNELNKKRTQNRRSEFIRKHLVCDGDAIRVETAALIGSGIVRSG